MKKVLIPTKLDKVAAEYLSGKGYQVVQDSETDLMALCQANTDAEALIVRSEKITPEIIDLLPSLKAIVRAGAGYNTIDIKYARRKNIDVMNTPGANANAVAEEVFAMMLAAFRHLVEADIDTRAGGWSKKKFMGREITGKTLGIVGLGNIGQLVAKHAQGFDMKLLAYDPIASKSRADELGVTLVSLEEVFANSDIVTLHIPENNETRGLVGERLLKLAKKGLMLINCARAGIVVEDDLRAAKAENGLIYCNDVYPADVPGAKTIADVAAIMAPHLGANTAEANFTAAKRAGEELVEYFEQGITRYVVNKDLPDGLDPIYQHLAFRLATVARAFVGPKEHISALRCSYYGALKPFAKWFTAPLTAALSDDLAAARQSPEEANAALNASGILLDVRETDERKGYGNSMTIDMETAKGKVSIRGTVAEHKLFISRIDQFDNIYILPVGNLLIAEYQDRPGVLAKITTLLGQANINIEDIHAPHDTTGTRSLAIIYTDTLVPKEMVEQLRKDIDASVAFSIALPTTA